MDNSIIALKCFIDGLGVRDVEVPEFTEAETNLIIELAVCAAGQIDGGGAAGFTQLFKNLQNRCIEEIGEEAAAEVVKAL